MERSLSLLDEALGLDNQASASSLSNGQVLLIEDCVETSGTFLIHHIIKRTLSSTSSGVIFVALSHPFSHYDRILRKLGCNLTVHRDNKRLFFFDMLMLESADGEGNVSNVGLIELYGKIQRALEDVFSRQESCKHVSVVIDDFSLIEVAAHGSSNHGLDFLHYCHTLTSELGCSLVILNHEDIYSGIETPSPILQMEYLADVLIKAEPLATGLATDVHGQLTVMNRGMNDGQRSSRNSIYNVHFRLKENGVDCFYPGSHS